MSQERFFRLLTIALLGAAALACVPESQGGINLIDISVPASPLTEIDSAVQVDKINNGEFKPYLTGDVAASTEDEPQNVQQLTRNLPN